MAELRSEKLLILGVVKMELDLRWIGCGGTEESAVTVLA